VSNYRENRGRDQDFRRRRFVQRRKFCRFCEDRKLEADYKDAKVLRSFMTDMGKIISRRMTGNCASHQREVTVAIKRARNIAILPFLTGFN